jgi:hypothetical protein
MGTSRRLGLVLPLVAVSLAACGSPLAQALTPVQALASYEQKVSQLKSAKFDINGSMQMQFSPELIKALSQGNASAAASLSNISFSLKGTGQIQYPGQMSMKMNMTIGGTSVDVEEVLTGGKLYIKNPLTGNWMSAASLSQLSGQAGQVDALTATKLPGTQKSVTNLGDTTLNGVDVYHYLIIPDKAKLAQKMGSSAALSSPQAQALLRDLLDRGNFQLETWIGKSDYLPRRISVKEDFTMDLARAMAVLGSGTSLGTKLPAGDVHFTADIVLNFHDFNAPVSIQAPTVN